ncbi:hypothetical protein FFF34_009885 [Inquilinus sp. KBS0705]|nr:hypothetical protein FFF34_009885 [Inquilinus sp. KBS0705]
MSYFIEQLKFRNDALFYFGSACLLSGVIFLVLSQTTNIRVMGNDAWFKPVKFALSISLYSFTMAWFTAYLPNFNVGLYNYTVIILLGFELIYIALQAGRGQLSHYNVSTPLYSFLFRLMGLAAAYVTFYTAYITILFFNNDFPGLPNYYLWSIRIGLMLFVIFSLEGAVMGARMSHTIGGPDGGPGLPFLNWSKKFGDPRIAHFVGMHALQVLPLLSYYFFRNTKITLLVGGIYGLLALSLLIQALNARPAFK